MGKHDSPDTPFTSVYWGYQCEGCEGVWAAVQLDEGILPQELFCLATEHCRGPVVALFPTDEHPPDHIPVIIAWFKPQNNPRFADAPLLNQHLDNDGLLTRPMDAAPNWVRARIGYFSGLRTF